MSTKRRPIKPGESLAIDPRAVHAEGPLAFFDFFFDPPSPPSERIGPVAVVHVRGPLDHHCGFGDSYEAIVGRIADALDGGDDGPPRRVLIRIDSPGGVVSGLIECVAELRRLSEEAGIKLVAYVDGCAASAAYAIACACAEVYLTPTSFAGSIGVISTMLDVTEADKEDGLRFVTLTSGARKSDGHPHVAISDAAIRAEQKRVDQLARHFYDLVSAARGLSVGAVAELEAALFLGADAVAAGLADGVMTWTDLLQSASMQDTPVQTATTEREAMLKIKNLIATTKAALAAETDAKKKATLAAQVTAYEATLAAVSPEAKITHTIEHKEKHVADDDEKDEHKEAVPAPEKKDDEEDDDEDAEEGETDEEAAAAGVLRSAIAALPKAERTKARAQLAAMAGKAKMFDRHGARLAKLEADASAREKETIVSAALAARRITPGEAKMLRTKTTEFVAEFMTMRPKAIVHGSSDDAARPPASKPEAIAAGCSDEELRMFAAASASSGIPVDQLVANHRAEMAKLNGANGAGSY